MQRGSARPGPAPAGLLFWKPEILGRQVKAHAQSFAPWAPAIQAWPWGGPGGSWAGPALGRGNRVRLTPGIPGGVGRGVYCKRIPITVHSSVLGTCVEGGPRGASGGTITLSPGLCIREPSPEYVWGPGVGGGGGSLPCPPSWGGTHPRASGHPTLAPRMNESEALSRALELFRVKCRNERRHYMFLFPSTKLFLLTQAKRIYTRKIQTRRRNNPPRESPPPTAGWFADAGSGPSRPGLPPSLGGEAMKAPAAPALSPVRPRGACPASFPRTCLSSHATGVRGPSGEGSLPAQGPASLGHRPPGPPWLPRRGVHLHPGLAL